MKNKYWTTKIPTKEGWYWFRYKGKRGLVVCPAELYKFDDKIWVVQTARNDVMTTYNMEKFGKHHFGDMIETPSPKLNS